MHRRDSHVHSNRCSSSSPIHHSSQLALLIMSERYSDPAWPPGTVRLQQIFDKGDSTKDANIILQPRPTADPNDPLNWTRKQKILNYSLACYYAMMVFAFVNATVDPTFQFLLIAASNDIVVQANICQSIYGLNQIKKTLQRLTRLHQLNHSKAKLAMVSSVKIPI